MAGVSWPPTRTRDDSRDLADVLGEDILRYVVDVDDRLDVRLDR